ncbi:beta-propeller domain-containing protein [Candidatus Bathyarchaeota archaeon]|nr:beta-propeller domain-containing protein [Candidatus Bathyarchaeota archaeon]
MKTMKIVILTLLVTVGSMTFLTLTKDSEAALNKFRSYEELREFLQRNNVNDGYYWYWEGRDFVQGFTFNAEGLGDFSGTNIQVEGVDEADIVKTDGEYIYVISDQKLVIVKAYPPEEAAVVAKITIDGTLKQIFINEERLIVFYECGAYDERKTFVHAYDVSDKENPIQTREITVEGYFFSSRMIGEYVYAVVKKPAWLYEGEVKLPEIHSEDEYVGVSATDVYYSNITDDAYAFTTVLAINVQNDSQQPTFAPILLGEATNLYVSFENIYIAIGNAGKTNLHRIHIENGNITYVADGQVPGNILNQFSMDEHEGYFRIATTTPASTFAILQVESNVYVLNMELDVVGKLENIAPGENMHSARFMGDTCYLVTFKKVDPFFVISLSNPYNPVIRGELKISGYSDYLHLYDANHVIGIGKETVEAEEGNFAWYQGVKISLFDVEDMSDPKELAKYEIGDRGTDSPILSDHKVFLFDKEKSLMVIPVTVAEIDESKYPYSVPSNAYGETVWQGAYVFTISLELEEKIALRGTITHIEDDNVHNTSNHITRTLYIDDVLYTISNNRIKMNSLSDLSEINTIELDA